MKLKEFKAPRDAEAVLQDGEKLKFKYLPRFLTAGNISAYNEWAKGQGERSDAEYMDIAIEFICSAVTWIDLQDDSNKDIKVTPQEMKGADLDMPTIIAIHDGIFRDIDNRANPTPPTGESSSSGSAEPENPTPTT